MSKTAAAEKKTDLELLTEAQARVTELEGEAKTSAETILKLESEAKAAAEKIETLTGDFQTANLKIDGFVIQVAKLEGEAKSADERAREIAARNGANLPEKKAGDRITGSGSDKEMPRVDFELLPPGQQRAFCRAGGTLTD